MSTAIAEIQTAVAEFDKVAAGLAELKSKYAGVVYDVRTSSGMDDAKGARVAIREPRYEIERIRKNAKAPILALGKKLDSEAARITAELEKLEQPINDAIRNEELRKERERQEKIAAEQKRVADLQDRVAELRGCQNLSASSGSALIAGHIDDLEALLVDESLEEFQQQGADAKAIGLARLKELHTAAIAHEAELARIKAEREELTRLRAEDEKRQAAERARIAEEERKAREQRQAEATAQAADLRKQSEENARIARERQTDLDRQEREAREVREAEELRISAERAELERQQAEFRKAQEPIVLQTSRPSDDEIIECVSARWGVDESTAVEWILSIDFSSRSIAA